MAIGRPITDERATPDGMRSIEGANECSDPHLANRSQVWVDRSPPKILRVVAEEVAGARCHHAARRARDHPYLARQLSDGEIWTAHEGVNPCGLVFRRGYWEKVSRSTSKYISIFLTSPPF
jgi:hypothetical protein